MKLALNWGDFLVRVQGPQLLILIVRVMVAEAIRLQPDVIVLDVGIPYKSVRSARATPSM